MLTLDEKDILNFKICLTKDLEKKIKMGYKNQFTNIVISIASMPKRYKKVKTPVNISEDMLKLESINKNIFNYLLDMSDVFGDNAVLNAKRIFEENSNKWGKKFYKSFNQNYNISDVKKLVKELYLNVNDIDYLSMSNRQLKWIYKRTEGSTDSNSYSTRYFNMLYEIKTIWLQHFIKAIAPGYSAVLDIVEEEENQIITNITFKEDV
jgi:hypothetical protein